MALEVTSFLDHTTIHNELQDYVNHLTEAYSLPQVTVYINPLFRVMAGRATTGRIEIAEWLLFTSSSELIDTIKHELAHTRGYWGHGPDWQMEAMRLGAKPQHCYDNELAAYNRS